jgi:glyoxylase-like metal-dependent hydrolase (beta-lactamase superfamily II)/8-oxo-dGTP pyrophosphatase MutT (NUDIX family)
VRGSGPDELLAVLRSKHLKFFGGFWAFPGGKLSQAEAQSPDPVNARRHAACRELFEETGILIARRRDGGFPDIAQSQADYDACRQRLIDDTLPFERFLAERGLSIHADDFALIGEITTPDFAPLRFATTFFTATLPPGQEATIWPGELERGEWSSAAALLDRWRQGADFLTPPSVMTLQAIGNHSVADAPRLLKPVLTRLDRGAVHPIFFAPCVQMVPLRTDALPPSTHTNAFIVGSETRYVIDPGSSDVQQQRLLFEVLDQHVAEQGPLAGIVLTHHHRDHISAATVCSQRYRAPILAHPRTAELLAGRVSVDRHIQDGGVLPLGSSPADGRPWNLEAIFTPGHASGHLAFFERTYGLLFAGDMLSTVTSMVIAPPDGDLALYLQSLHKLKALPTRMILPAHGNVSTRPVELIDQALEHRAKREQQLIETLAEGPSAIDEMTQRMYKGTPEPLIRFARAQVLAGLLKLQSEGRAAPVDGERWRSVPV